MKNKKDNSNGTVILGAVLAVLLLAGIAASQDPSGTNKPRAAASATTWDIKANDDQVEVTFTQRRKDAGRAKPKAKSRSTTPPSRTQRMKRAWDNLKRKVRK